MIRLSCPSCGRALVVANTPADEAPEVLDQRCTCFLTDNEIEAAVLDYWREVEEGEAYRRHPEL